MQLTSFRAGCRDNRGGGFSRGHSSFVESKRAPPFTFDTADEEDLFTDDAVAWEGCEATGTRNAQVAARRLNVTQPAAKGVHGGRNAVHDLTNFAFVPPKRKACNALLWG